MSGMLTEVRLVSSVRKESNFLSPCQASALTEMVSRSTDSPALITVGWKGLRSKNLLASSAILME